VGGVDREHAARAAETGRWRPRRHRRLGPNLLGRRAVLPGGGGGAARARRRPPRARRRLARDHRSGQRHLRALAAGAGAARRRCRDGRKRAPRHLCEHEMRRCRWISRPCGEGSASHAERSGSASTTARRSPACGASCDTLGKPPGAGGAPPLAPEFLPQLRGQRNFREMGARGDSKRRRCRAAQRRHWRLRTNEARCAARTRVVTRVCSGRALGAGSRQSRGRRAVQDKTRHGRWVRWPTWFQQSS
jgi:hypothetical protein